MNESIKAFFLVLFALSRNWSHSCPACLPTVAPEERRWVGPAIHSGFRHL